MTYAIEGMRALVLVGWDGALLLRVLLPLIVFDGIVFWWGSKILQKHLR
jgi:hypothetical protein